MVIYLLLKLFDGLFSFIFNILPTFETPLWLISNLPDILKMCFSFNQYLPVYEGAVVFGFLISSSIAFKVAKVLLSKVGLEL